MRERLHRSLVHTSAGHASRLSRRHLARSGRRAGARAIRPPVGAEPKPPPAATPPHPLTLHPTGFHSPLTPLATNAASTCARRPRRPLRLPYGLTRDEPAASSDPADVYGPGFRRETFRVLGRKRKSSSTASTARSASSSLPAGSQAGAANRGRRFHQQSGSAISNQPSARRRQ